MTLQCHEQACLDAGVVFGVLEEAVSISSLSTRHKDYVRLSKAPCSKVCVTCHAEIILVLSAANFENFELIVTNLWSLL